MFTKTNICNMALAHLGSSSTIANIDEASEEARACKLFYDVALFKTLRSFAWPFAQKYLSLAEVSENPNSDWSFAYAYPNDCLDFQRIVNASRVQTAESLIEWEIGQGSGGLLIFTDEPDAIGKYTAKAENPSLYPSDFVVAQSYLLSSMIAPRISVNDPARLGAAALNAFNAHISAAKAGALNEQRVRPSSESGFSRARS